MVWESGHSQTIVVIIPTRKLNDITIENIKLLSEYFERNILKYEIIIVSNNDNDRKKNCHHFKIYHNPKKNAAISRNIGLMNSTVNFGTFIYLDDDIVIDSLGLDKYLDLVTEINDKTILAPYLTGHLIMKDYRFNIFLKYYYSWVSKIEVRLYSDIQGKSLYSFCFPPIFSQNVNYVEWIPGGVMTLRGFDKLDALFDLDLFADNYQMEDYYLSNSNYMSGIPILMLPVIFEHKINYNKHNNNLRKKFIETFQLETSRLKIQRLFSISSFESIQKYKLILVLNYLYKLKAFRVIDFAALFAILYLLLCTKKKSQSAL